jgi:hypothetical protein
MKLRHIKKIKFLYLIIIIFLSDSCNVQANKRTVSESVKEAAHKDPSSSTIKGSEINRGSEIKKETTQNKKLAETKAPESYKVNDKLNNHKEDEEHEKVNKEVPDKSDTKITLELEKEEGENIKPTQDQNTSYAQENFVENANNNQQNSSNKVSNQTNEYSNNNNNTQSNLPNQVIKVSDKPVQIIKKILNTPISANELVTFVNQLKIKKDKAEELKIMLIHLKVLDIINKINENVPSFMFSTKPGEYKQQVSKGLQEPYFNLGLINSYIEKCNNDNVANVIRTEIGKIGDDPGEISPEALANFKKMTKQAILKKYKEQKNLPERIKNILTKYQKSQNHTS